MNSKIPGTVINLISPVAIHVFKTAATELLKTCRVSLQFIF